MEGTLPSAFSATVLVLGEIGSPLLGPYTCALDPAAVLTTFQTAQVSGRILCPTVTMRALKLLGRYVPTFR